MPFIEETQNVERKVSTAFRCDRCGERHEIDTPEYDEKFIGRQELDSGWRTVVICAPCAEEIFGNTDIPNPYSM